MVTWAVSARGVLAPLAVLVPILATLVGALWAFTIFPPLALLVIAAGFAATAMAGRHSYGARPSLVAASTALLAAVVSLPLWYAISINTSICGKNVDAAWEWAPLAGGALVFFVLGSVGFRSDRAGAVTPMAFLFGVLAMALLYAAVPGTQGICET